MRLRLLALSIALATALPLHAAAPPQFTFQSNFWVNLHHFLRSVGRGMPVAASLAPEEQARWDAAVAVYRDSYSKRDVGFDQGMVKINNTLRLLASDQPLPDFPDEPKLRATLQSVAPIYRKHWWPGHDTLNRSWTAALQPLLERYGTRLGERVAAAYGKTWPAEPIAVDVSILAGPVGAYTTANPTHTTISSTDPGYRYLAALEMIFHESSHQWGTVLQKEILRAEEAQKKSVPRGLWHAVLFTTPAS
jgi:hypothetical protein